MYLVTGVTGNTGKVVAETLLAQLWQIDQLPDTRLAPITLARAAE